MAKMYVKPYDDRSELFRVDPNGLSLVHVHYYAPPNYGAVYALVLARGWMVPAGEKENTVYQATGYYRMGNADKEYVFVFSPFGVYIGYAFGSLNAVVLLTQENDEPLTFFTPWEAYAWFEANHTNLP